MNDEMKWLLKGLTPSFKALSDFRKDNIESMKKVFKEFVYFCDSIGLFSGKLASIDGSKFKANNSRERNFKKETLEKKIKRIEQSVNRYLEELKENDEKLDRYIAADDNNRGSSSLPEQHSSGTAAPVAAGQPTAVQHSSSSSSSNNDNKYVQHMALQKLLKKKGDYEKWMEKLKESGASEMPLTDPESRLMKCNGRLDVCYNVLASVDSKFHLIPEYHVTNDSFDYNQLSLMAIDTRDTLQSRNLSVTSDPGFWNSIQIKTCVDNGITPYISERPYFNPRKRTGIPTPDFYETKFTYIKERDVYICPAGAEMTFRWRSSHKTASGTAIRLDYMTGSCKTCQFRSKCTSGKEYGRTIVRWEHEEVLDEMRQRLKTDKGRRIIQKRKELSEHPFGTIKRDFDQGYLLLKGLAEVVGEVGLSILAYNLRRVFNVLGTNMMLSALSTWHPRVRT